MLPELPAIALLIVESVGRASLYGGCAAGVVWAFCRWRSNVPPAVRAALWWLVCAKFVIGLWPQPVGLPVLPPAEGREAAAIMAHGVPADRPAVPPGHVGALRSGTGSAPNASAALELLVASEAHWLARSIIALRQVSPRGIAALVLVALWVIGLAAIGWRSARHWRALARLSAAARPVPLPTREQLGEVAARVGVPLPDVASSARVNSPLLIWCRRLRVLLPDAALTSWPRRHRDAALAHELVHIRRGDLWWGLVPALAERLFFFHPLARLAAHEYLIAREAACDADVVADLAMPAADYGRMLIGLGVRPGAGALAIAGAPHSVRALKRRLTMLSHASSRRSSRWMWGIVAGAAIGALPFTLVARTSAPDAVSTMASVVAAGDLVLPEASAQAAVRPQSPRRPAATPPDAPPPHPAAPPPAPAVPPATPPTAAPPDAPLPPPPPAPAAVPPSPAAPPPTPATAPPDAPPPPPPVPGDDRHGSDDSWVLIESGRTYLAGSGGGLVRARRRADSDAPLLWVRRDGREYVIRDAAVIAAVRHALADASPETEREALREAGRRLGEEMGRAEAARAEAAASVAQQAASADRAEARAHLEAKVRALAASQAEMANRHAHLASQQRELARALEAAVRNHVQKARGVDAEVRRLVDEALAAGQARPVP